MIEDHASEISARTEDIVEMFVAGNACEDPQWVALYHETMRRAIANRWLAMDVSHIDDPVLLKAVHERMTNVESAMLARIIEGTARKVAVAEVEIGVYHEEAMLYKAMCRALDECYPYPSILQSER